MDHRIVLQELKLRWLLSQSCICSRQLPFRRKYTIIIESELHMFQRIFLKEENIQWLLSQSWIWTTELSCRNSYYDDYWVRAAYVQENCPFGETIWLLLRQSCVCATELACRKTARILGYIKHLPSRRPASPTCRQQHAEEWNPGHDVLSLDKHSALRRGVCQVTLFAILWTRLKT